ncbi:bone marrow stromal antigen 2 [Sarcophilus harrisii]|uniref:bone marrow stromal antigen 2 n=1 Tax=Sarcophilus harrisii TaxID=9305 RepID=UPI000226DE99|nr:bone marrow stromal antigen 2 [Sarcophilus harrisii]
MERHWKMFVVVLAIVTFILLVPLVVFAIRANSETCLKSFELQNKKQLLEEKLRQSKESLREWETQWWSCSNISKDLKKDLEELTSQKNLMLSQLQELKGENQDLAEKLRKAEAALQLEREKKNPEKTNSALPGPQISKLLVLGLVITLFL